MINKILTVSAFLLGFIWSGLALSESSSYSPSSKTGTYETRVPASFTPCASDFGNCIINENQVGIQNVVSIFYGAQGKYVVLQGRGNFTCSPSAFNISDPLPNVRKTCWVFAGFVGTAENTAASPNTEYVTAPPTTMQACAVDFADCTAENQVWTGVYGANGVFSNIAGKGSFKCLPGTFSIADPVPNVQKKCYISAVKFGSFTLNEKAPLITTLVPGIQVSYSLNVELDSTRNWSVGWNHLRNGATISQLPETTSYSLTVHFDNCPGYSVFAYGDKSQNCNFGLVLPENQSRMSINKAVTGTISYRVTDKVIYPDLSYQ